MQSNSGPLPSLCSTFFKTLKALSYELDIMDAPTILIACFLMLDWRIIGILKRNNGILFVCKNSFSCNGWIN